MSDNPTDQDEEEQPCIVTTEGATLTYERVWIRSDGWACGVEKDGDTIYRYPPHRVRTVVDRL